MQDLEASSGMVASYSIAPRIPPSPNFEFGVPNYGLLAKDCPNASLHASSNSIHGASKLELENHENHIKY